MKISTHVQNILVENPNLSNEEVVAEVLHRVAGATTTAASVASIKSGLKKAGLLPQRTAVSHTAVTQAALPMRPDETPEERSTRIRARFNTLERMAKRVSTGEVSALIVSGPPGLGKSFTIETELEKSKDLILQRMIKNTQEDPDFFGDAPTEASKIICGSTSAVGLFMSLWEMRNGGVLVLDDCDDVFRDETCLNLLKAVLDCGSKRIVSWNKKSNWLAEYEISSSFEYKGAVVFCTNLDFESAIAKGSNMGPHYSALIDRSLYLSLTMRTLEDFVTRIRHVAIEDKWLASQGLTEEEAEEVLAFMVENHHKFYGLSLRLIQQIAFCYLADQFNWKEDIIATKMKTFY